GASGGTSRRNAGVHLEYLRDVVFPRSLDMLRRREVLLKTYSDRSLENARRAADDLFGYQNSRKARIGGLAGLQDPAIMDKKKSEEADLRAKVEKDASLKEKYGSAWDDVAKTIVTVKTFRSEYN